MERNRLAKRAWKFLLITHVEHETHCEPLEDGALKGEKIILRALNLPCSHVQLAQLNINIKWFAYMLSDPVVTPDIILLENSGTAYAHWLAATIDIKSKVISTLQRRPKVWQNRRRLVMEPPNDAHGTARAQGLDHREDHTTSSLLELVPSLEHSIVGILNHNGELNDQDSGRGYLVRVTNLRKFCTHHSH